MDIEQGIAKAKDRLRHGLTTSCCGGAHLAKTNIQCSTLNLIFEAMWWTMDRAYDTHTAACNMQSVCVYVCEIHRDHANSCA